MSEARYTKGPWVEDGYDVTAGERRWRVASVDHISISAAWQDENPEGHWGSGGDDSHRDVPDDEREANARLIAAAPELLSIVERVAAGEWSDEGHVALRNDARAALSKAQEG